MPIYEFYCGDCNTIFNFFSSRVNTDKQPLCPCCKKRRLKRQMSSFATPGRAKEDGAAGDLPDIDETRLLSTLESLGREAEKVKEDDPRQMANLMRKVTEKTGLNLGDGMEEALARMEAGDDPEQIEKEMGDMLETEEPFALERKRRGKASRSGIPSHDDTLYEL